MSSRDKIRAGTDAIAGASCPCAPLGKRCAYDVSPHSMSCYMHVLSHSLHNMLHELPVLKYFVEPFVCNQFEACLSEEGIVHFNANMRRTHRAEDFLYLIDAVSRVDKAKVCIASLSNYEFAETLWILAKRVSEARGNRSIDVYLYIAEKTIDALKGGAEQADILSFFEWMFEQEVR